MGTDNHFKVFYTFHFVFCCLSETRSRGQQPEQRDPNVPLPGYFHQPLQGDIKMFPSQPRDIITPACPWPTLGSSTRWACPKHLPRETSRRHPEQMPEKPQLANSPPGGDQLTALLLSLPECLAHMVADQMVQL